MSVTCSRCGKTAILAKTWNETVKTWQGDSIIKHEQYVCPDKDCQTIVEQTQAENRKLSLEREQAAKQRETDRLAARKNTSKQAG